MPTPHLDSDYLTVGQPSTNGDSHKEVILTYLRNRFERLYRQTQPRAAMRKAQRDFELRRDAERALESEESQLQ